ncbi:MAG: hypothetical protein D6785_10900 [Planctomycetota bacterium]|nr:MAG: hypothetical protein D6785_10900 [Planctomycetota bacterium]
MKKWICGIIFLSLFFIPAKQSEASLLSRLRSFLKKIKISKTTTKPVQTNLMTNPKGVQVFNQGIQNLWDTLRPLIQPSIQQGLKNLKGKKQGKLTIEDIQLVYQDLNAGPALSVKPYASANLKGQQIFLKVPNSPGWTIHLLTKLRYDMSLKVFFWTIRKTFRLTLTIKVTNLQAATSVIIDTSNPRWPKVSQVTQPTIQYGLSIGSTNKFANFLLKLASPIIKWFLNRKMKSIIQKITPQLNQQLQGQPKNIIGLGHNMGFTTARPDLLKRALEVDKKLVQYHLPYNTVTSVVFSSPTGWTPVSYIGYGDSAIWTGHYLAGEAFRYHVTKDSQALSNIKRVLKGIEFLFDVCKPGDGLLARFAAPLNSPTGQQIYRHMLKYPQDSAFVHTVNGVQYAAHGHISRDQYCGVMLGLATAYDYVADPQVKAKCKELIERVVDYLERNKWIAKRVNPKAPTPVSAPFVQTPKQLYNFVVMAYHVNPQKYGPLLQKYSPLTTVFWIPALIGIMETHFKYYGFNLSHATSYSLMRLDKNPKRYQDLLRSFLILRTGVSHHRNAWFNLVTIAVVPSQKNQFKDQIVDDIRRFALRDLRETAIPNPTKTDPNVPKIKYKGIQFNKIGWNLSGIQNLKPTGNIETIAKYPQPVERRPHTDFLWQRSPFNLSDNRSNPRVRNPGVDMVLPYWMARVYGVLR